MTFVMVYFIFITLLSKPFLIFKHMLLASEVSFEETKMTGLKQENTIDIRSIS